MRQMSGQDAAFLYAETPNWHMHVSGLMVFDPKTAPKDAPWSFEKMREVMLQRIPEVPQLRWKLVDVPFGLDRPGWIEGEVDIDFHLRRIGVPAPGGRAELGRLVGQLVSYKLNRDKPLWEAWVIEGLEGGKVALLQKMHHALIDGVSGAGLAEVLLDLSPEIREPSGEVKEQLDTEAPSPVELMLRGAVNTAWKTPGRVAKFALQSARQAAAAAPSLQGDNRATIPMSAPRTTLNADPTAHRAFSSARVPLERVRVVKDAYGVKLNDVVLALVSTALRNYLTEIGDLPEEALIAQCPVSLRSGSDDEVGNKVGSMFTTLATDIEDPAERLLAINESTKNAKAMREAMAVHQIMGVTETTAPGLIALAARMYTRRGLSKIAPPAVNVVVSNVPGPPFPLYITGAELESLLPMGPLLMGMSLNITVFSYNGSIDFGVMVCPESIPNPDMITDGIEVALAELEAAIPTTV